VQLLQQLGRLTGLQLELLILFHFAGPTSS
jgi:hypothetical protein